MGGHEQHHLSHGCTLGDCSYQFNVILEGLPSLSRTPGTRLPHQPSPGSSRILLPDALVQTGLSQEEKSTWLTACPWTSGWPLPAHLAGLHRPHSLVGRQSLWVSVCLLTALLWTNFLRIFAEQRALEDKDLVSLRGRGQSCLLFHQGNDWAGLLTVPL